MLLWDCERIPEGRLVVVPQQMPNVALECGSLEIETALQSFFSSQNWTHVKLIPKNPSQSSG